MNRLSGNEKPQVHRLFVAAPLPHHVRDTIEQWTHTLKEQLVFRKWTHPQDYHITLQFLGDVVESNIETVKEALRTVNGAPIELVLSEAGAFGKAEAPRVLWAGVSDQQKGLNEWYMNIVQATSLLGFVPEDRPYSPHITVARTYKGEKRISEPLNTLAPFPTGVSWQADHIVLMRTHMNKSPMYEVVERFPKL